MISENGASKGDLTSCGASGRQNESVVTSMASDDASRIGRWVMVHSAKGDWLACVVEIGSNFISVQEPESPKRGYYSGRFHFNEIAHSITPLTNHEADAYIHEKNLLHKTRYNDLMVQIGEVTQQFGLSALRLSASDAPADDEQSKTGLAVMSSSINLDDYRGNLVLAKETTLPKLFKDLKENNEEMMRWLAAETLPLRAAMGDIKDYLSQIDDRLFNISLYAGLVESVVLCREGEPAPISEKLHVMQRRMYMDEECIASYHAGGISIQSIDKFDDWLGEPENMNRILPFPRTIVAMQVRRKPMDRDSDGSLASAYVNIQLGMMDRLTFLYIRNGDQIWRLQTEISFPEMIFPDKSIYNPADGMVFEVSFDRLSGKMMTRNEYDFRVAERAAFQELYDQWFADHPCEQWLAEERKLCPGKRVDEGSWEWANPYRSQALSSGFIPSNWHPLDPSSIYYDDATKLVGDQIKKYNRIAMIIQGLFDRSEVLSPHPPVKTWTPEGFDAAITLVYDAAMVLHDGDEPDIAAYLNACNAQMNENSFVTGQYEFWLGHEAEREMRRRQADHRMSSNERYRQIRRYKPFGNPGPAKIGQIIKLKGKNASFQWQRESLRDYGVLVDCSLTVPVSCLFNVSAYTPGDFKQFFRDPRTRSKYMQWAHLLLAAEDWWHGR